MTVLLHTANHRERSTVRQFTLDTTIDPSLTGRLCASFSRKLGGRTARKRSWWEEFQIVTQALRDSAATVTECVDNCTWLILAVRRTTNLSLEIWPEESEGPVIRLLMDFNSSLSPSFVPIMKLHSILDSSSSSSPSSLIHTIPGIRRSDEVAPTSSTPPWYRVAVDYTIRAPLSRAVAMSTRLATPVTTVVNEPFPRGLTLNRPYCRLLHPLYSLLS